MRGTFIAIGTLAAILIASVVLNVKLMIRLDHTPAQRTTQVTEVVPTDDRAYADIKAWTDQRGDVTYLRRNAVVYNWTVGYGRQLRVQASEWYLPQDDGSFKLAGIQYLSGLGR